MGVGARVREPTHWSCGICRCVACSAEQSGTTAPWLTMLLEFISFGYGQLIIRLSGRGWW